MNPKIFKKRLRCLYTTWRKHKHRLWGGSDVLVITTNSSDDDSIISNHFHLCLFGYIFPDTITIFTYKQIHFICNNPNSSSLLKHITSSSKEAVAAHVTIHENPKADDASTLFKEILAELQNQQDSHLIVGYVGGEEGEESLDMVQNEFEVVDVKNGLSRFAVLAEGIGQARGRKDSIEGKGDFDIYLQELSKEAEEMIFLADVKKVDMNSLRKRRKKVVEIGETNEYDDASEWVLV